MPTYRLEQKPSSKRYLKGIADNVDEDLPEIQNISDGTHHRNPQDTENHNHNSRSLSDLNKSLGIGLGFESLIKVNCEQCG